MDINDTARGHVLRELPASEWTADEQSGDFTAVFKARIELDQGSECLRLSLEPVSGGHSMIESVDARESSNTVEVWSSFALVWELGNSAVSHYLYGRCRL